MIFSATSDIYNAYHLPVAQRCGSPAKTTQYELEAKMKHHFRSERNSNPIERTSPPHSPPPASQPATSPVVLARMRFKSCWIVPVVEKILQMDCWIGFDWIVLGIMQKLVWSDIIGCNEGQVWGCCVSIKSRCIMQKLIEMLMLLHCFLVISDFQKILSDPVRKNAYVRKYLLVRKYTTLPLSLPKNTPLPTLPNMDTE